MGQHEDSKRITSRDFVGDAYSSAGPGPGMWSARQLARLSILFNSGSQDAGRGQRGATMITHVIIFGLGGLVGVNIGFMLLAFFYNLKDK